MPIAEAVVGNGGNELLMRLIDEVTGVVSARGMRDSNVFVVCSELEAPSIRSMRAQGGSGPADRCFTLSASEPAPPDADEFVYGTIWGGVENGQMHAQKFMVDRSGIETSPTSNPHPFSADRRCEAEQAQLERLRAEFPNSWITVYFDNAVLVYKVLEYVDESSSKSTIDQQRMIGASTPGSRVEHKLSDFNPKEISDAKTFITSIDEALLVDFGDSKTVDGDLVLKLTLLAERSSINRQLMKFPPELIEVNYLIRAVGH